MSQIWAIIIFACLCRSSIKSITKLRKASRRQAWLISLWNRKSGYKKGRVLNRKPTFRGSSAPEEMSKKYGSGAPLEPSFKKGLVLNRKYLSIIYLFLIAGLFYLISPDISGLDREHKQFRERFDTSSISPRFWEQGLLLELEDADADSASGDIE